MSDSPGELLSIQSLRVDLAGARILDDVSLSIREGELVALIGANGSGKTTLLRATMGLVKSTGTIHWNRSARVASSSPFVGEAGQGRERQPTSNRTPRPRGELLAPDEGRPAIAVQKLHVKELAQIVSYLPQNPTSIPGQTVTQAILLGRHARRGMLDFTDTAEDCRVLGESTRAIGVEGFFDRTLESLSGGQRQRVFLARCLAQESPTLLLDEPATFLDLKHQVELYQLLRKLVHEHGRTILMACHDLNLAAMHADRMILLDGGKLVADGTPDALMTPETIGKAFGVRMKRIDVDGKPHLIPVE